MAAEENSGAISDDEFFAPEPAPDFSRVLKSSEIIRSRLKGDAAPNLPMNWPPPGWESDEFPADDSVDSILQWFRFQECAIQLAEATNRTPGDVGYGFGMALRDAHRLVAHLENLGWANPPLEEDREFGAHGVLVQLRTIRRAIQQWFAGPGKSRSTSQPPDVDIDRKGDESSGESQTPAKKAPLSNWAVGLEDGETWWLFRKARTRRKEYKNQRTGWEQHGRVEIPSGNAAKLLTAIAESGGAIARRDVIQLFRLQYSGKGDGEIRKVVTYALSKAKRAIRDAIARSCGQRIKSVGNPIPFDGKGNSWMYKIEVGFAILWEADDGDQRLVFRMKEDLDRD